jgi:hypothetical protein
VKGFSYLLGAGPRTVKDKIFYLDDGTLQLTERKFFEMEAKQGKGVVNFCGGDIDYLISILQNRDEIL